MKLKDKIFADMQLAMKAGEATKVSVLRMLKAAIMKFEVSGGKKLDAGDDEVQKIIAKEVKQRKDSIEAYKKGGRNEQAAAEEAEMKILQTYMPAQMNEDELRAVVSRVISQTGATSKADFGKVIDTVMAEVKGKAEGQAVSRLVGEVLK